ncbi:ATP-binding cassette subfamily B protein [Ilumatobacter fluminis]|uniref:ATP-binding cassette subfamily B protein n=1 Tax=Ilumatobacter fluminis TaxID=467091 RepID=A0A4V3EIT2_9ACTN|nr:ABC transporter ATP-binding protein [Ilumatobacter fluminis]TDT15618.1 ATP-binding cassette subfamily B protein [Ilumatobacter fluminis]
MSIDTDPTTKPPPGQVVRILADLHGHARRVIASFIGAGAVAGSFEALALVLFTAGALRATGNDAATDLGPLDLEISTSATLLAAAVAILCAGGLHAVQARMAADASLRVLEQARRRVSRAFLRADWSTQAEQRDGALYDSMFHLSQHASMAASFGSSVFNGLVIMLALLVAAIVISPVFTGVLIVSVIPIVVLLRPISGQARRRASENIAQTGHLSEDVASTDALAFELRAFGVTDRQLEQLDDVNHSTVHSMRRARFASRLAAYWFKDLALLMFIVVVGVINLIWDLSQPSAAAAILLVIRMLGYAQQGYNAYQNVVEAGPAVVELDRRLDELESAVDEHGGDPVSTIGSIEFDHVSYRYPNGRLALDDISFRIEPDRVLGVVGRSGAGKSTVAELLLRMRQPSAGRLLVDGVDANVLSIDDWHRLVTIVPQDPRIRRASIADNIVFLRDGFSRDDVERASRASHLHADIAQFEHGYDTELGSRNRGLSGGQRQRLAIARALISEPSLLVLDEPTSALDRHSERGLQQTLGELRGRVTMVVIAHRLSTLDLCDDLLVLDEGRVVAFGPRSEIVDTVDFFASLPANELDDR